MTLRLHIFFQILPVTGKNKLKNKNVLQNFKVTSQKEQTVFMRPINYGSLYLILYYKLCY